MKKAKLTALIFVHFVVALLAFASCRQNVEYIELYQTRYIVMEFTGSHGPGDILLSNGDWVLARDINNLTKDRLDATPAVGILAFEKQSGDKSVPNTPVVIGLEIKRGVKFSATDNNNIPKLEGNLKTFNLASGKESLLEIKKQSDYSETNYPLFAFAADYSVDYKGVPEKDWYIPNIKELSYAFIGRGGIESSIQRLHELDPDKYPTATLDCDASYRACNQHKDAQSGKTTMSWFLTWSPDPNDVKPGAGSCRVAQKSWEQDNVGSGLVFCAMVMHDFEY